MVTSALHASTSRVTRCPTTNVSFSIICRIVSHSCCEFVLTFQLAEAALAYFNRTLYHYDIATGEKKVTADYDTTGPANATHTNSFVPLTTSYVPDFPSPIYPTTMATATSGY